MGPAMTSRTARPLPGPYRSIPVRGSPHRWGLGGAETLRDVSRALCYSGPMAATASGIAMRGISKRFGDVQALAGVDFALRRNEVHVLAGENGAGKTTLMNVLAGLYQADAGDITVDGRPVRIGSPRDALDAGIWMVHQHF